MTTNCISSLAWLSGSSRSLRAWSWTYEFGRDALCSLETVSSCGCTAGLHFPASLGGYWTTLPSIPWGYDLETVSSSLWMHCWTTFPSVPWGGGYEAMWQFYPIRCKYKWCRPACLQPILFSLLLVVWGACDCGAEPYAHRSLNAWEGSCLSTAPLALPVVLGREWEISLCCVWTVACFFSYLLLRVRPFQQRKHGEKWEVFLLFWLFTGVRLVYDIVLVWISYAYTYIHSSWDSFPNRG